MSSTLLKIIAATTFEELQEKTNEFLSKQYIEMKQFDYQTDGFEKPNSLAILYSDSSEGRD